MIDLNLLNKALTTRKVEHYIPLFVNISTQLEEIQNEWIDGNIHQETFDWILDLSDFLAWEIAKHHINNCQI